MTTNLESSAPNIVVHRVIQYVEEFEKLTFSNASDILNFFKQK